MVAEIKYFLIHGLMIFPKSESDLNCYFDRQIFECAILACDTGYTNLFDKRMHTNLVLLEIVLMFFSYP